MSRRIRSSPRLANRNNRTANQQSSGSNNQANPSNHVWSIWDRSDDNFDRQNFVDQHSVHRDFHHFQYGDGDPMESRFEHWAEAYEVPSPAQSDLQPSIPEQINEFIQPDTHLPDWMKNNKIEFANLGLIGLPNFKWKGQHIAPENPPNELRNLMCPFCTELPYIPQKCIECGEYGCKYCFVESKRQNRGCYTKPLGDNGKGGFGDHTLIDGEDILRPYDGDIEVECRYGCTVLNPPRPQKFTYIGIMQHYASGCPKTLCRHCHMYQYGETKDRNFVHVRHNSPIDCFKNLQKFSTYMAIKHKESQEELCKQRQTTSDMEFKLQFEIHGLKNENQMFRKSVDDWKQKFDEIKQKYDDILKMSTVESILELKERMTRIENNTTVETPAAETTITPIPDTKYKAIDDLNLFANPTDGHEDRKIDPIIYGSYMNNGRRLIRDVKRNTTWLELKRETLRPFGITDINNYVIFDIRCRVRGKRDENEAVGTYIRNVHTVNVVPRNLFEPKTCYSFDLKGFSEVYCVDKKTSQNTPSTSEILPLPSTSEHTENWDITD